MRFIAIAILILILPYQALYAKSKQNLPIPRFVSTKSSEINVRTGPHARYPIKWIFIRKNEPLKVTAEFEGWRKIQDIEGQEGWIRENMLSGKRFAIITVPEANLYRKPNEESDKIAKFEKNVRIALESCKQEWCHAKYDTLKGYIKKEDIWGVFVDEQFK